MFLYKMTNARRTFNFKPHPAMSDFELSSCQVPQEFSGPDFEAIEDLQDIDGTKFARPSLTARLGGLLITEELAPSLRDYLQDNGCILAERRVITPLDTYVVLRAFNLYNDNPDAPLFRMRRSPNLKELSIWQYASIEFVDWLKENFDTSGLEFHYIQRDEPYEKPPKKDSNP